VVVELHLDFFVERVLKVGVNQFAQLAPLTASVIEIPCLPCRPKIPASLDGVMTVRDGRAYGPQEPVTGGFRMTVKNGL